MRVSAVLLSGVAFGAPAHAEPPRVAIFNFELVNTSPAASTTLEINRLHGLDTQLRVLLATDHRFTVIDDPAQRAVLSRVQSARTCNGCELDAAQVVGAQFAAFGWVQKVSNLILNVNVVIEDVATGHRIKADSVDIRGNTDESWRRGLRYLIDERFYRDDAP